MIVLDRDFVFFTAHFKEKDGNDKIYILKTDFTVDRFYVQVPYLGFKNIPEDNIEPDNLFDKYKAMEILEKANSHKFELEVFDHYETDKYGEKDEYTKKVKVNLTFTPHMVNVKMTYFDEGCRS